MYTFYRSLCQNYICLLLIIDDHRSRCVFTLLKINTWTYKMLVHEINACSFDKWYSTFRKVTIQSKIIPLSDEVLNYLRSDESLVRSNTYILLPVPYKTKSNIESYIIRCSQLNVMNCRTA